MPPLMKCGCVATGTKGHGGPPVCVTHYGLTPDAEIVAEQQPNFESRVARCAYCGREEPSSTDLPFFIYTPAKAKDEFYCGCRGWE